MFGADHALILRQDEHYLQTDINEHPLVPRHLGVASSSAKMIFEPIVRLAQTVHLSCVKNSSISKPTKSSFHLSLVT